MMKRDPVELTPEYKAVVKEVDEQVRKMMGGPYLLGHCHRYWRMKKQILLRDYGIHWRSPAEMNPDAIFD